MTPTDSAKLDLNELKGMIGTTVPPGPWVEIQQPMIDLFAELTGDRQWIHIDVERARRESPFGAPVVHGLFILALIPALTGDGAPWIKGSVGINYGADRVRFISPVLAGQRVRAEQTLKSVEPYGDGGAKLTMAVVVEIEGNDRPACSVEMIGLIFP